MPEEKNPQGATGEGPQSPSPTAVAEPGTEAAPTADLSKLDLSTLPQFREYDSKMQKQVADSKRETREIAARVAQEREMAQRDSAFAFTRSNLEHQGLDEKAIAGTLGPLATQLGQERSRNEQRSIMDEFGFAPSDLKPEDYGQSANEMRANLRLKRERLEIASERQEIERMKAETVKLKAQAEKEVRRETGADRVTSVGATPAPEGTDALLAQMRKEMIANPRQAINIKHKYRIQHPELSAHL